MPMTFAAGNHQFHHSLLLAIHQVSPDGILVVDEKNTVVSHNHRFLDIWKICPKSLHSDQSSIIAGRADQPVLAAVLERVENQKDFLKRVRELYSDPDADDHCELKLKDGRTLERHSTA